VVIKYGKIIIGVAAWRLVTSLKGGDAYG